MKDKDSAIGTPDSARRKILEFLRKNVGRIVDGREIRRAGSDITEWARRVRELRDEHGYQILTNKDRRDIKQGQYLLESIHPRPAYAFKRGISKETRAFVLDRNGRTCQMCGIGAGDPDPLHSGRKTTLVMGHIIDKSKGGSDEASNLSALCSNCNEGLQNIALPRPRFLELMKSLRRATVDDQMKALEWLEGRFGKHSPKK